MSKQRTDYPDDYFADTRMTFGEHIEELRFYLLRALYGFMICLVSGFFLDFIGTTFEVPIGLGRPVLEMIKQPVVQQMNAYNERRLERMEKRLETETDPEAPIKKVREIDAVLETAMLKDFVELKPDAPAEIPIKLKFSAAEVYALSKSGEINAGENRTLTTLSVQEAFVVYFKVCLLCGVVLSSPWIFIQLWTFIAAGLYPHEKRNIHIYLPFSIGLFLSGVALCQFVVLPKAVGALLGFNEWLGLDPDLRLNEWLGFAVILPLVFGVSFQTPLVMMFMERIGTFTADDYAKNWKLAVMFLAVFSALITPTPDAISMAFLFTPMFALYLLGIWLCRIVPKEEWETEEETEEFGA